MAVVRRLVLSHVSRNVKGSDRMRRVLLATAFVCSVGVLPATAAPITYNFSWSGSGGYSMTGNFTFDTASAADGAIRDTEVTALFFEGFLNSVSIGTNSSAHTLAGFNFNFDPVAGQFFLGGVSGGDSGQQWNLLGAGLGFVAGNSGSVLTLQSTLLGVIGNPVPLTASLATSVPEPGSMLLLGTGLLGAGVRRWRQRRA